jgi:hypothetical protein
MDGGVGMYSLELAKSSLENDASFYMLALHTQQTNEAARLSPNYTTDAGIHNRKASDLDPEAGTVGRKIATNSDFDPEKKRDLYFAKGNLYYSLRDSLRAKQEYFKSLASLSLNLSSAFEPGFPQQLVTPAQVLHSIMPNAMTVTNQSTSSVLQTLAKMYQDDQMPAIAVRLYYLSLATFPTANTCNNIGILLAPHRIAESIGWYELGLQLDCNHVHILVFKSNSDKFGICI